MLSNTLNTNEIKNRSAAEVEFTRLSTGDRKTVFAKVSETPSQPYRLTIAHQETGSGMTKRRRGVVRFDLTSISGVDSITPITTSAYIVLDAPIGAASTSNDAADVLANLMSFCATTGAGTTVLFDGTGNGSQVLLTGGI